MSQFIQYTWMYIIRTWRFCYFKIIRLSTFSRMICSLNTGPLNEQWQVLGCQLTNNSCKKISKYFCLFKVSTSCKNISVSILLHLAWVVDDAKCIVVMRVCVSVCVCVCMSVCVCTPTLLDRPGCNLGCSRGCPLVVHYWADLQSAHGLHCYGNITRTVVTSLHPSRDMTT